MNLFIILNPSSYSIDGAPKSSQRFPIQTRVQTKYNISYQLHIIPQKLEDKLYSQFKFKTRSLFWSNMDHLHSYKKFIVILG